jgi:hypothetical protein
MDIIDKIFEFITTLDSDQITEGQAEKIADIVDMLDPPELQEAAFKKRVRRDLGAARQRRKVHLEELQQAREKEHLLDQNYPKFKD